MSERIVDTHKEIAAILETSVSSVRREVNTYPDPLPVRRFGGGRVWARRERLLLHRRRHAEGAKHPIADLPIVDGREHVARFVRLSLDRVRKLAPCSVPPVKDPLPVHRRADGTMWAYRDALIDWLDRRSVTAGAPRYRRRWGRGETAPETAGTRETQKARAQTVREVVIDGPPEDECAKVGEAA